MTTDNANWFWDMVHDAGAAPPAARMLGFALTSVSPERGEIEATFQATAPFTNMLGTIQGGFLAAMLDVAMSSAVLATLPPGHYAPTLEMKLNYLRPAQIGVIAARGRLVHRGGTVAFLAGELLDPAGEVLTTATATARLVKPR